LYRRQGELRLAEQVLSRSLEMIETGDLQQVFPYTAARLGLIRVLLGDTDAGLPLLVEAVRLAELESTAEITPAMMMLGEAYMALGRLEDAHDMATRARGIAADRGERGHLAWTLWLLGEVEARSTPGSIESASDHYSEALAIGAELGMRPLVAHCHLGLGKLYWRTGQSEQAREHLPTAATMYREMGMTYWLEQVEAEMRDRGEGR
jgi:tetratricopeptide (TPR) repeat protein